MKIAHVESPEFGTVPIIERRVNKIPTKEIKDESYLVGFEGIELPSRPTTALSKQVSGTHYKDLVIQPIEYIQANNIPYMEGNVIKYVTRWRAKAGLADLEKAKHYLEMLIEFETKNV